MRLGLDQLIDPRLMPYADDARAFRLRRSGARGPRNWDELQVVRAERDRAPASEPLAAEELVGGVPVRIITPAATPCGVLLDIHSGGFYMGAASDNDARNHALAHRTGLAVVSVDYRLAPECPWPAAPDDCETVARWLAETAEARFGTRRLVIGGVSAGATLAMATLLRLRDLGMDAFAGGVLQYGTFDLSAQTPAGRLIADEYFLEAYVGGAPDRCVPDISPIYAELSGLPPVLMIVGSCDVLLEDNLAMVGRLSAAGVDVDLRVYPESPHGFTLHPTAMARAALDDVDAWIVDCARSTHRFSSAITT